VTKTEIELIQALSALDGIVKAFENYTTVVSYSDEEYNAYVKAEEVLKRYENWGYWIDKKGKNQ
jgi:hypothetical protein